MRHADTPAAAALICPELSHTRNSDFIGLSYDADDDSGFPFRYHHESARPLCRVAAVRLRVMLAALQQRIYADPGLSEPVRASLVNQISGAGFGLIDDLEGVIR